MLVRKAGRGPGPQTCAVAVMAKASLPGRTKTRLAPPLTPELSAELNTAFLADIAENLALAGRETAIAPFMAFGPPGSAPFFEANLPAEVGLVACWYPDFGECLYQACRGLLDLGYGSACVLNSDSPTLPTAWLVEAARALARPGDRIVLGPSADGGYYLLGLKAPHRRLFEEVAWSTGVVAGQTRARARELGLETVLLPAWFDVDDAASLGRLARDLRGAGELPADGVRPYAARHTAAMLDRLLGLEDIRRALEIPAARAGAPA